MAECWEPALATSSARYRVHVDLDYEGKHAEAGSIVSNLPSTSVSWLRDLNYITLIPKGGKAEDFPQLDPRTGAPVASAPTPPEPGVEEHVAAGAEPAPPEDAHPDPDSEAFAGVPSPGVPDHHPALESADDQPPEPERRGRARKKSPPSTTPDPDSEQVTAVPRPDEPPPAEPPADTSEVEEEEEEES